MKGTEMLFKKRCTSEKAERHNERSHHHSDHYKLEEKKEHPKDSRSSSMMMDRKKMSQKEPRRDVEEYHRSMKKNKNHHRLSPPFLGRHDGRVELAAKGSRNTDSSSDSESNRTDHKNSRNKRHKRKCSEDSYEELSRKKRQIESELSALLAEEAENKRNHFERKKSTRSESKVTSDFNINRPIKQERISEDDDDDERRRKNSPKRSNEKQEWGKKSTADSKKPLKEKEKPNFSVSGKLAEDTNTFNGVVIKYNEPKEARKPKRRWRLYPFKGESSLEFIPIHRQSAYLLGRSRLIADIPIDHPSCSKQHAVLQYRLTAYKREDGCMAKRLRPYIIDLDSSNGTFVNNKKIEPRRYVELFEKDVVKFGFSTREYVMLHEESRDESLDDNIIEDI